MSRKRIRDDNDKRRLVEEWDQSGLAAAEFAAASKIHWRTLCAWGRAIRGPLPRGRRSRTRPVTRKVTLVEVGPAPSSTCNSSDPRLEVIMPSGCHLVMFADWTPELVAELMVLLEAGQ